MTTTAPIAIITTAALTAEWKATDAEVTLWSTMAALKTADVAVNKLGLFGADLTDFKAKCAADTATTAKCVPATYEKHNGWGVGINFAATAAARSELAHGAGFVLSKQWVQVTWVAAATATVISGVSTKDIAVATPTSTAADVTDATTYSGFDGWILTGALPATLKAAGFAAKFFLETDADVDNSFFFEADETADIFSLNACSATTAANVANTAFKLVSATALCTAATSVIAASLLF